MIDMGGSMGRLPFPPDPHGKVLYKYEQSSRQIPGRIYESRTED
jgi:hypothetical protein